MRTDGISGNGRSMHIHPADELTLRRHDADQDTELEDLGEVHVGKVKNLTPKIKEKSGVWDKIKDVASKIADVAIPVFAILGGLIIVASVAGAFSVPPVGAFVLVFATVSAVSLSQKSLLGPSHIPTDELLGEMEREYDAALQKANTFEEFIKNPVIAKNLDASHPDQSFFLSDRYILSEAIESLKTMEAKYRELQGCKKAQASIDADPQSGANDLTLYHRDRGDITTRERIAELEKKLNEAFTKFKRNNPKFTAIWKPPDHPDRKKDPNKISKKGRQYDTASAVNNTAADHLQEAAETSL